MTTLTKNRAHQIKEQAQQLSIGKGSWVDFLDDVMTPQEDDVVLQHWLTLPDNTSWMDAFHFFLNQSEEISNE